MKTQLLLVKFQLVLKKQMLSKRLSYYIASVLVISVALALPPSASLPLRAATV